MTALIRLDRNPIPDSDEIRLFAKVRNEAKKLPFFLSYYRALGVNRFFIIDNGSNDGTVELLSQASDCHTFITTEKLINARAGMDWIQPLLNQYGRNRWCIVADADELLVYPDSETVALSAFCHALDRLNADAFFCILLDMYPNGNINEIQYNPGQPFLEVCPFFDQNGYRWLFGRQEVAPVVHGGPRIRVFYPELLDRRLRTRIKRRILTYCGLLYPLLKPATPFPINKVPLVRWNERMSFGDAAHDISSANLAKGHGVLLHFKFLDDFSGRVREELKRKAYLGAEDYQKYSEGIHADRPINFMCDMSLRYTGTRQLLDLGLTKEL
jgi:hypothetical protein